MIKNHFRQRVPAFIDLDKVLEFDFETTEELSNHSFIQGFLNVKNTSTLVKSENLLMVVSNEGFNWWVIGYISNPDDLKLPEWDGGKYIVQYENGEVEVLTKESKNPVVSSRGDEITLRDGTKCKNIRYEDWKK